MDKRTTGIIGLVAAILFCGIPGLCGLCIGPLFTIIGLIPGTEIDVFGSSDPGSAIGFGLATLCLSIIFVAIPVLVWYFGVREIPAKEEVIEYDSSLPEDM
jgi:hypothetical protein